MNQCFDRVTTCIFGNHNLDDCILFRQIYSVNSIACTFSNELQCVTVLLNTATIHVVNQ